MRVSRPHQKMTACVEAYVACVMGALTVYCTVLYRVLYVVLLMRAGLSACVFLCCCLLVLGASGGLRSM